jgi:ubiquinone/menaquinone biosynthesis C-methylase UbiE
MSDFRTDYDYELRAYNERLRVAAGLVVGERVLDVGCGAGQSTRDAGRAVAPGQVLGIDLSAALLERARQSTAEERLDNVRYVQADAQVHPFAAGEYDVAISRFGVMFFADPVAALRNIAHAVRPGGRLVLLVWQRREDNAWVTAVDDALARPVAPRAALDAFSLGDPTATRRLLEAAGLRDVHLDDVREPVFYGRDTASAMAWVQGFSTTQDALARLPPDDAARAVERLHATLDAHLDAEAGVVFDSRGWMITARTEATRNGER